EIKNGGWWVEGKQGSYVGTRQSDGYAGITLGIIGLGRIGARVAALMRPWNINIIAYDPYVPDYRFLEAGTTPVGLDELLRGFGNRVLPRPHGGTVPASAGTPGRSPGPATEWVNTDVLKALRGELPVHIYNQEAIPKWLSRFGGKPIL